MEGFALIRSIDEKTSARGGHYLDMMLRDADDEVNAKLWEYTEAQGTFEAFDLVKVRGTFTEYNGQQQFRVERMRPVEPEDDVCIDDYVPTAPRPGAEMFAEIWATAEAFRDDALKQVVLTILEEDKAELLYWPGALKLHHALRSGLLHHTLTILQMAKAVAPLYPFLNAELLFAGVILHDVEKLREFKVSPVGLARGYTAQGNLIGHLVGGAMRIKETCARLGVAEDTSLLLQHMLLSHHGVPEFGSPVRPLFPEAQVLNALDTLDAHLYQFEENIKELDVGTFSRRISPLDNRLLYNHGRSGN
jgi:3'-5' exoribonuclease